MSGINSLSTILFHPVYIPYWKIIIDNGIWLSSWILQKSEQPSIYAGCEKS